MNRSKWTVFAALALMLAAVPTILLAETNAEEKAWVRAMTPGQPHARLADRAGEWTAVVTIWQEPGAEPITVKGVSTKTMIMGGRFLQEEFSGEFMGGPFRGVGIAGYDNVTGEYVSIWYDNTSTGIHQSTGRDNGKGGQTFTATHHEPVTGREVKTRSVSHVTDRDHHSFEAYNTLDDGTEFLHMRVDYTRVSY